MESWWCTLSALLAFSLVLQLDAYSCPLVGNPGECPKYVPSPFIQPCPDKCSNDYECASKEKCCYQGCGRMCVVAITPINPNYPQRSPGECPKYVPSPYNQRCPDKCSYDYECDSNEKCCYQGCGRTCVLAVTPINPNYPQHNRGECPKYVPSPYNQRCPDKCSYDNECASNEKCCYQGCGRTCVLTVTPINPNYPQQSPGECPKYVPSPYNQRCPDKCSYDYECDSNEKCCYQGCGRTCVLTVTPINPNYPQHNRGECPKYVPSPYNQRCPDKCSYDNECASNEKCCYQGCGRTCVLTVTPINPNYPQQSPGECPKYVPSPYNQRCPDKCSYDYECDSNEKCCYQGCGRTCVLAITPINPNYPQHNRGECPKYVPSPYNQRCPDKCSYDYECDSNEKCCYQGCGRTCVLTVTPINPNYPQHNRGECPKYVPSPYNQRCPDKCSYDYECAYNEKCCYQGCGRTCVLTVTPINPNYPQRSPGECPKYVPSPYNQRCPDKCSYDYECASYEKCCYQGCGRTCVLAITPINPNYPFFKPGQCPKYVPLPYNQRCPDKCSNDYQCASNEKCCYQGCGRMCVAVTPITTMSPVITTTPTNPGVIPGKCPTFVLKPPFKPCPDNCTSNAQCAYNEMCCFQVCGRTCVVITPITPTPPIVPVVKPGVCPKYVPSPFIKPCPHKCSNDNHCPNHEKCCYHGCGRTCVDITLTNPVVKPGVCPKYVPSPYIQPCPDKCSNDNHCPNHEKCCYHGCGRTCVDITLTNPVVKPGVCPIYVQSPYIQPCPDKCSNDNHCPNHEKCCYHGCGRTCVDITLTNPVVKPGVCPKYVRSPFIKPCPDKCSNDNHCPNHEKCCYQGCGRTCVDISLTNPVVKPGVCPIYVQSPYIQPCPDKCSNDNHCPNHEKCCYHGCGRTCVDITLTNPGVKPGECPKYVRSPYFQHCADACSNDYDCDSNEKCCSQGCGRKCVLAVTPGNPITNPGVCPKYVRSPYIQPCPDKCSNDYECASNEKCCYQGCGRMCVVAVTPGNPIVRPGECPKHVLSPYIQPCPDKCSNDYHCADNEKCCHQGCGRVCVAITPIKREKPGVCPIQIALKPYGWPSKPCVPVNRCSDDYSCPGNKKCCTFGCGLACVTPQPAYPCKPYPSCLYLRN